MPRKRQYPKKIKSGSHVVTIYRTPPGFTVVYWRAGVREREWIGKAKDADDRATELANELTRGLSTSPLSPAQLEACQRALARVPEGFHIETVVEEWNQARERLKGASLLLAADDFAKRNQGVEGKMVPEIVDELIAHKRGLKRSDRHIDDLESRLKSFKETFNIPMLALFKPMVEKWLDSREGEGRNRNNYLAAARAVATYARGRYLPKDWDEIHSIEEANEADSPPDPYSPEELEVWLDKARTATRPSWRALETWIGIGALAGIREAERRRIDTSDIKWDQRLFVLEKKVTKVWKRRLVPICDRLHKILEPLKGQEVTLCEPWSASNFGHLADEFELVRRHNGFRDGFISYRLALGIPKHQVAEESGNSVQKIEESYQSLTLADGRVITRELALKWFGLSEKVRANHPFLQMP